MASFQTLLYPFAADAPDFEGYAWTVELATRIKARLFLLISDGKTDVNVDTVYHSLLEAQGYYLQHYQIAPRTHEVKPEPSLVKGDLEPEIVAYLEKNPNTIVVVNPEFGLSHKKFLRTIIERAGGTIHLSEPSEGTTSHSVLSADERFYHHLFKARLHKHSTDFLSVFGGDKAAFNYLRKYFQGKSH